MNINVERKIEQLLTEADAPRLLSGYHPSPAAIEAVSNARTINDRNSFDSFDSRFLNTHGITDPIPGSKLMPVNHFYGPPEEIENKVSAIRGFIGDKPADHILKGVMNKLKEQDKLYGDVNDNTAEAYMQLTGQ